MFQRSLKRLGDRWPTTALTAAFLALAVLYAVVVPPGEAADEPAHLAYAVHLLERRSLPPLPRRPDAFSYEAHQPPLDYLATAGLLAVLGGPPDLVWTPRPDLDFDRPGSRAFAVAARTAAIRRFRALRFLRAALWGTLTLLAATALARRVLRSFDGALGPGGRRPRSRQPAVSPGPGAPRRREGR